MLMKTENCTGIVMLIPFFIQQGASRSAAAKAAANARLRAREEFEPLFKAAVGLLH